MSENPAIARAEVQRWENGQPTSAESDAIAREEPLEIRVRGQSVSVSMRTPGHDSELAAGFLFSEGLIRNAAQILEIAHCASAEPDARNNIINVFLTPDAVFDTAQLTRHVFASSSCGICGKASIEAVHLHFPPVQSDAQLSAATLNRLPDLLRSGQTAFAQTGGLHGAALFGANGDLKILREDVGRHNAVDKVIGHALLRRWIPLADSVLLVSGRVSFEIVQKALAAGIPIIAGVSAPSSLAIELAQESGQTLIGFLRANRFNVYTHPRRVCP